MNASIAAWSLVAILAGCSGDSNPAAPRPPQSRIVFAASRTTFQPEIYVMNADGSEQRRLTSNTINDGHASWAPDGSYIVFARRWQDAAQRWWSGIFRMQPDGSQTVCVDSIPDVFQVTPRISPDGSRIAYCQMGARYEVWVMNVDGSGPVNLTPEPEQGADPDWSPDGTRIAYARNDPALGWRIYTMKSDGSDTVKVLETSVLNSHQNRPRWSHSGEWIAYVDTRGNTQQKYWIYRVHSDGSNVFRISPNEDVFHVEPTWSPDDQRIAYRDNYHDGHIVDSEIYTIGIDGTGATNISRFPGAHDLQPDWGPNP